MDLDLVKNVKMDDIVGYVVNDERVTARLTEMANMLREKRAAIVKPRRLLGSLLSSENVVSMEYKSLYGVTRWEETDLYTQMVWLWTLAEIRVSLTPRYADTFFIYSPPPIPNSQIPNSQIPNSQIPNSQIPKPPVVYAVPVNPSPPKKAIPKVVNPVVPTPSVVPNTPIPNANVPNANVPNTPSPNVSNSKLAVGELMGRGVNTDWVTAIKIGIGNVKDDDYRRFLLEEVFYGAWLPLAYYVKHVKPVPSAEQRRLQAEFLAYCKALPEVRGAQVIQSPDRVVNLDSLMEYVFDENPMREKTDPVINARIEAAITTWWDGSKGMYKELTKTYGGYTIGNDRLKAVSLKSVSVLRNLLLYGEPTTSIHGNVEDIELKNLRRSNGLAREDLINMMDGFQAMGFWRKRFIQLDGPEDKLATTFAIIQVPDDISERDYFDTKKLGDFGGQNPWMIRGGPSAVVDFEVPLKKIDDAVTHVVSYLTGMFNPNDQYQRSELEHQISQIMISERNLKRYANDTGSDSFAYDIWRINHCVSCLSDFARAYEVNERFQEVDYNDAKLIGAYSKGEWTKKWVITDADIAPLGVLGISVASASNKNTMKALLISWSNFYQILCVLANERTGRSLPIIHAEFEKTANTLNIGPITNKLK